MMRNIKVILVCLFLLASVNCFALETTPETKGRFVKGLNTYLDPMLLDDQELSQADNVFYDKGCVITRDGYTKVTSTTVTASVVGLYQYTKTNGDTWCIVKTSAGKVYKADSYGSAWTQIYTGGNANPPSFVTFPVAGITSTLVMFDGGVPQKWDGTGNMSNLLDRGGTNAPSNKYAIILNQRIFACGNASYPNRLYFTDLDDAEDWSDDGASRTIDGDDGDCITGLANYAYFGSDIYNKIFLTKKKKLYLIDVDPADVADWTNNLINTDVGCYSHWSIKNVGMAMVFWDGWRLQSLNGLTLTPLSTQIHNELSAVDPNYRGLVPAEVWNDKNHYYMSFVKLGATTHDYIYVYDTVLNAWAKWNNMKAESLGVLYDENTAEYKMCMGGSDGYVYELWDGTNDDNTTITSTMVTKAFAMRGIEFMKFLQYGYAIFGASGNWTSQFGTAIDDTNNFTYSDMSLSGGGFVLGTSLLGSGVLGSDSIARRRFDRDTEVFLVKFKVNEDDKDEYFKFYGLTYYYQTLGNTDY